MTPGFWPWLLIGAMWIAMGVHQIAFASEYQVDANQHNLKWNFGGRYNQRWWRSRRGMGFLYIGFGVSFALLHIRDDTADPWLLKLVGGSLILIGAWGLFAEPHASEWLLRRRQRRLEARLARGSDAYFEELRSLEAYPPHRMSVAARRWGAAIALTFGALSLILANTI
jgi:hypothetical protein